MRLDPPLKTAVLLSHSASLLTELLQPAPHRAQPGLLQLEIGAAQKDGLGPENPARAAAGKGQGQLQEIGMAGLDLDLPPENTLQQVEG